MQRFEQVHYGHYAERGKVEEQPIKPGAHARDSLRSTRRRLFQTRRLVFLVGYQDIEDRRGDRAERRMLAQRLVRAGSS